jgi:hypothetical protein
MPDHCYVKGRKEVRGQRLRSGDGAGVVWLIWRSSETEHAYAHGRRWKDSGDVQLKSHQGPREKGCPGSVFIRSAGLSRFLVARDCCAGVRRPARAIDVRWRSYRRTSTPVMVSALPSSLDVAEGCEEYEVIIQGFRGEEGLDLAEADRIGLVIVTRGVFSDW